MSNSSNMDGSNCCYIVYWYPTIFHKERERQSCYNKEFVEISDYLDIKFGHSLEIKKEELQENQDLKYTIRFDNKDENSFSFIFKYVDSRRNGFVVYAYDRNHIKRELEAFLRNPGVDYDKYIDDIFISCYHHAKDIYHKHEIHHSSDGRLIAYFGDKNKGYIYNKPDISKPNHEVIGFFIQQYETLFDTYAHTISREYAVLKPLLQDLFETKRKKIQFIDKKAALSYLSDLKSLWARQIDCIKEIVTIEDVDYDAALSNIKSEEEEESVFATNSVDLSETPSSTSWSKIKKEIQKTESILTNYASDSLRSVLRTCCNALTEYNYCKSLLESKYNTEYKHDLSFSDSDIVILGGDKISDPILAAKDDHRKIAFNIRNSVRYIEEIRNKCNIWENELTRNLVNSVDEMQQTSDISNILNTRLGKLSLALGIFGVIFGLLSFFNISVNCFKCNEINTSKQLCICDSLYHCKSDVDFTVQSVTITNDTLLSDSIIPPK